MNYTDDTMINTQSEEPVQTKRITKRLSALAHALANISVGQEIITMRPNNLKPITDQPGLNEKTILALGIMCDQITFCYRST